ncbi:MAG: tRNA (adenosine(37)-N6)-threonylcarbamoyltransferase complex ATPase subunit type 1 TsaE [Oscillospiraceae bacterium]|nr:tRNA (adenosine(37)-N6)-threonylcarbamoyltransferase complex ATPase subunit type 1 TsaE [Oscillospiraceae bacterium]
MSAFISNGEKETEDLAEQMAAELKAGDCLALFGEMGAGKTAFVRGLARGLGCPEPVSSPTFAIINEYRGGRLPLFHFDMYRVSSWDDLETASFFDYLESGGVTVTEWSENIEAALPENARRIMLEKRGENTRAIKMRVGFPLSEPRNAGGGAPPQCERKTEDPSC